MDFAWPSQAPSTGELSECRAVGNRRSPEATSRVLAVADDGRGDGGDDAAVDEEKGEGDPRASNS